jgi:hypothetical protein
MIDSDVDDVAAGRVVRRLTSGQRRALALAPEVREAFDLDRLETIANSYYRDLAQETAGEASKGEQNASIAILLDWVEKARRDPTDRARMNLEALWTATDDDLAFRLLHASGLRQTAGPFGFLTVSELTLDTMEGALLDCRTQSRGPLPASMAERRLVAELIDAWEVATGRTATHNPKIKTQYTGDAESEAGRFVTAMVKVIDPDVLTTTISTLIDEWLKARRRAKVKPAAAVA